MNKINQIIQGQKNMNTFRRRVKLIPNLFLLLLLSGCSGADDPQGPQGGQNSDEEFKEIPFDHVIVDSDNPTNPHCKTVGDINGDGFPDILAASATGNTEGLFWYEYPNWNKYQISSGSFTTDMQVGDIDNDGDLDVIIPRGIYTGSTVHWFENPGPGGDKTNNWTEHTIATAEAHDVEVADLNEDGRLDVVVRLGDASILLQETPDSWSKTTINIGGRGGLALNDINGDGRIDLVLDGYWLMAPEDRKNGSWERFDFGNGWEGRDVGVTPHDLNNDGRLDIIIAPAESQGRLTWYQAPENPTETNNWKEHPIDTDISYIHTFKVADMDLDGDIDIVTAEMHQSERRRVTVYHNLGDALSWEAQVIATTGSHNIRLADIDKDGDMDIVGANYNNDSPTNGNIELWRNNIRTP
jgi:hypothetical protein